MADWDSRLYLKFESDRTRPPRDLLAQVPLQRARKVVDLGCGPGNSTELLVKRYPDAQVTGLDSSPDMLRQARERLPAQEFVQADVGAWRPEHGTDLLFANATFQWVPDHAAVLKRLLEALPPGGVLAVQMPDNMHEPSHRLMGEVAREGDWASAETEALQRGTLPDPEVLLRPVAPALPGARHVAHDLCPCARQCRIDRRVVQEHVAQALHDAACGSVRRPISRPMASGSPRPIRRATTAR